MDYRTLDLDFKSVFKTDDNECKVIGSKIVYEYKDNQITNNVVGTKYTVVLEKNKYQTIDIKIDETPCITQEEIDDNDGFALVKIYGFVARLYKNKDGNICVSATAESIEVV